MSDGAGYIGKAAMGVFNNDNFKALNCMTHISVGSLGPGKSLNARFKKVDAEDRTFNNNNGDKLSELW